MSDQSSGTLTAEMKCEGSRPVRSKGNSFKNIRKARKKFRFARAMKKADILQKKRRALNGAEKIFVGPTPETLAKLTPDPLVRFKKQNILDDEQIQAFQRIRQAVQIITDGTQLRISCFTDVAVQTSRCDTYCEGGYEIKIKNQYNNWIDQMTIAQRQAGPILDIIIDEMSLSSVDRKWGKRKGWAKDQLRDSLDLYGRFSAL